MRFSLQNWTEFELICCLHLLLQSKYLSLINLLINEPSDIDLRVAIRTEFTQLGINEILAELKKIDNTDLGTQVNFQTAREENERAREEEIQDGLG